MSQELEAAAADSVPALIGDRRGRVSPVGTPCANCGAALVGPWCHACGQNADLRRRAILPLAWEAISDLFHLDGRLRRTLPDLFFRPGRLARDYMEGRIARHVPPFRMFLVALLFFIFAAAFATHRAAEDQARREAARTASLATSAGRAAEVARLRREAAADLADSLRTAQTDKQEALKDPDENRARAQAAYLRDVARARTDYDYELTKAARIDQGLPAESDTMLRAKTGRERGASWFRTGLHKATANPDYYWTVMFTWGHRAAVLLLPIVALSLALVYVRQRRFFIHDHLLVAMDLLSFSFLVWGLGFLLPAPFMLYWLGLAVLWTPVNLYQTLRGAYGSGVLEAGIKTLLVWLATVSAFGSLLAGLMVFTLAQL